MTLDPATTLDLSRRGLIQLGDELWSREELRRLFLGWNQLEHLPPALARLRGLTHLYLHDNLFEQLPDELCALVDLRVLDLSHNPRLASLPEGIGSLGALEFLYSADQALDRLPDSVGELRALV